jgi:hypothetical protein
MFLSPKRSIIASSLACYAAIAGILSFYQRDYVSADFVAYVTIARRTIEQPSSAITTYWSSLFSWMMTPLLIVGVDDLIAGRIVLLISGLCYLSAIHRLTVIHSIENRETNHLIQVGTMTCSVIHAAIWANYLLAPDLLANAFLYSYFCLVSDRQLIEYRPASTFSAGMMAGMAYLAKAYMLPFCLLHVVLTIMFDRLTWNSHPLETRRTRTALAMLCLFGLGLGLLAGPWIACLSWKCGCLTFSTAGSANHANMSPENFRKDPLWNPGLTRDFIFEPHLTPDWSALQDQSHFLHQMIIVTYNVLNCIGLIPIWLGVFIICVLTSVGSKRTDIQSNRSYVCWVIMTVVVYCGGYTVVNLEARYVIPTVVPLLCHVSLKILCPWLRTKFSGADCDVAFGHQVEGVSDKRQSGAISPKSLNWDHCRPTAFVMILVVFIGGVDIHNLIRVATVHPQSTKMEKFREIADQLCATGGTDVPFACSDWHFGLYIAYAADRLTNYWGSPLAQSDSQAIRELEAKDIKVFLRFAKNSDDSNRLKREISLGEGRSWTRTLTIHRREFGAKCLEVYERR